MGFLGLFNGKSLSRKLVSDFHVAAAAGDTNALEALIAQYGPAIIDRPDGCGETALMQATYYGHQRSMYALLAAGANIHLRDKFGRSVLYHALCSGHPLIARVAIENRVDISKELLLKTVLMFARHEDDESFKILMEHYGHGVVDTQDEAGATALMMAAAEGRKKIVRFLLGYGAKMGVKDLNGYTVFDGASKGVLRILRDYGGKLDVAEKKKKPRAPKKKVPAGPKWRLLSDNIAVCPEEGARDGKKILRVFDFKLRQHYTKIGKDTLPAIDFDSLPQEALKEAFTAFRALGGVAEETVGLRLDKPAVAQKKNAGGSHGI